MLQRQAPFDVEIAGVKVPAGCVVAPVVSSANHDEAVFEKPEVFDIHCKIPRVFSMSSENHRCIGQPLARLEARVALEEWFASVSSFARKGQPQLSKQHGVRGFEQLTVVLERRPVNVAVPVPEDSVVKQAATAEKLAGMSDQQLGLDKRQIMTVKIARVWDVSTTTKLFCLIHPTGASCRGSHREATSSSTCATAARSTGIATRSSMAVLVKAWFTSSQYSSHRTPKAARGTCTRKSLVVPN
jgi:hypothetical protein